MSKKATYKTFALIWIVSLMMVICVNSVRYFADSDDDAIAVVLTEEEDQDEDSTDSKEGKEGGGSGKEKSNESPALVNLFGLDFIGNTSTKELNAPEVVRPVIQVTLSVIAPPPEA